MIIPFVWTIHDYTDYTIVNLYKRVSYHTHGLNWYACAQHFTYPHMKKALEETFLSRSIYFLVQFQCLYAGFCLYNIGFLLCSDHVGDESRTEASCIRCCNDRNCHRQTPFMDIEKMCSENQQEFQVLMFLCQYCVTAAKWCPAPRDNWSRAINSMAPFW